MVKKWDGSELKNSSNYTGDSNNNGLSCKKGTLLITILSRLPINYFWLWPSVMKKLYLALYQIKNNIYDSRVYVCMRVRMHMHVSRHMMNTKLQKIQPGRQDFCK